ncbi:nicotinate-nucleotide pyrophosphorylase [Fictibacillus macauensis ZFHKF-1]|uniref:Probable nicotinate-nucleotide pyrophosphorylase [carboxylating] n=1 Tax=Fictibacillus macauensis ZFHKF-1 TaxID=1196324 RepID=I8UEJ1_9BACL|nr:carboxylating nicotinate-nucleotide diphosphorylase [Fictibacillus macauensis]EIT85325.1 nicotinate-nucleotide pyrophosphorylase [Fictibacillus macauensis ZFHKF-1]
MNRLKLQEQLKVFLLEDLGERDVTSTALFHEDDRSAARLVAKEKGIISGMAIIKEAFTLLDARCRVSCFVKDGEEVMKGQALAEVEGPAAAIYSGERVVLNLLQRMSGIATLTHQAVAALNSKHTRICDTRKTTPGLRMFEKYAVTCGGGYNHRFGLYDAVMIKDNHIAQAGSITEAVAKVKKATGHMVKVEVEVETLEQVKEAVAAQADVIMFDNASPEVITEWRTYVSPSIVTEASGGISLETLHLFQDTGVDYISLGMLTHSAKSLDISLNYLGGVKDEHFRSIQTTITSS